MTPDCLTRRQTSSTVARGSGGTVPRKCLKPLKLQCKETTGLEFQITAGGESNPPTREPASIATQLRLRRCRAQLENVRVAHVASVAADPACSAMVSVPAMCIAISRIESVLNLTWINLS